MTVVTPPSDDTPAETFAAFAVRIGKSRPYVSKLVAEGRISSASLTPERLIIPRLALADMEAAADPARSRGTVPRAATDDATYAHQRARKTKLDADRADLELRARRRELIDRSQVASVFSPLIRELRDALINAPRDTVLDPVQAADCEAAITAALTAFSVRLTGSLSETPSHGGAATEG
jgi:hypothetical protein